MIRLFYPIFLYLVVLVQSKLTDKKIRYYAVGEYGSQSQRPHYHILIFNMHNEVTLKTNEIWDKGFIHTGEVNGKTINYSLKYMMKDQFQGHKQHRAFVTMSTGLKKDQAIGYKYLELNKSYHLKNQTLLTKDINGNTIPLPRYYTTRIFDSITLKKLQVEMYKTYKENAIKEEKRLNEIESLEYHNLSVLKDVIRRNEKIHQNEKL